MISATLITLNEEKNIERALKSLQDLVDEIIVVDSGSKDKTVTIAEKLGAKVFFRKFDNFSNQKNWAITKANGEWILSLDADEQIPQNLADEIKTAVQKTEYVGYLIPRRNFILGGEIRHSRWSPDLHIWLWKKASGKWIGDVHEEVTVSGKVGHLKNPKINNQEELVSDFIRKNNLYSSLLAKESFKKGIRFSFFNLFKDPISEFLIRYLYKLGFLDGWRGFVLSYLMAIYKASVWIKIYEIKE